METLATLPITLSIVESKCSDFKLNDYALAKKEAISADKYEFDFNIQMTVDNENKRLIGVLVVKLNEKVNATTKYQLAELKSITILNIINLDDLIIKKENGSDAYPIQLLTIGAGIAASTTRGMLSVKLENTLFENATMPLVDPNALVPQLPIT